MLLEYDPDFFRVAKGNLWQDIFSFWRCGCLQSDLTNNHVAWYLASPLIHNRLLRYYHSKSSYPAMFLFFAAFTYQGILTSSNFGFLRLSAYGPSNSGQSSGLLSVSFYIQFLSVSHGQVWEVHYEKGHCRFCAFFGIAPFSSWTKKMPQTSV